MKLHRLLTLIAILISAQACGTKIPMMPLGDSSLSQEESVRVNEIIAKRQADLRTVKALYQTTIQYGKSRERIRQLFLYEVPSNFRAEIIPTTSTYSLGLLIASRGRAQYIDSQSGEVINSESVRDLIYDTLHYDAEPEELLRALLGFLPESFEIFKSQDQAFQVYSDKENYLASILKENGTIQTAQFLDEKEKRVVMQIEYQNYKEYNGRLIPAVVFIRFARGDVRVELKVSHMEINGTIAPKNFVFIEN